MKNKTQALRELNQASDHCVVFMRNHTITRTEYGYMFSLFTGFSGTGMNFGSTNYEREFKSFSECYKELISSFERFQVTS